MRGGGDDLDQFLPHAFGVILVVAENDGLGHRVGGLEVFPDLAGNEAGPLLQNQAAVEILGVVLALLDDLAKLVEFAFLGCVADRIHVGGDADDLVGREETVFDALLERIGVHRFAEVGDVADLLGFLGRGGQAQMGGPTKIIEYFAPGGIVGGTAAVTFIDDDEIEKVRRKLAVDLLPLFLACDRLIEGKVDLIVLPDLAVADLVHHFAERCEVLLHGLVHQDVAVGQKQDAFAGLGFPQAPDDLKSRVGLAGAGRHDQQHALLPLRDRFDCAIDGDALVVARLLAAAVGVERLLDQLDGFGRRKPFPLLIDRPQFVEGGKPIELKRALDRLSETGTVVEQKPIAVTAEGERGVEHFGIAQCLLHAVSD